MGEQFAVDFALPHSSQCRKNPSMLSLCAEAV